MREYAYNIGLALTRLGNALIAGSADETTSSRAHRARMKGHKYWGWTADAIDWVFFWQPNHCERAYLRHLSRTRQNLQDWTAPASD